MKINRKEKLRLLLIFYSFVLISIMVDLPSSDYGSYKYDYSYKVILVGEPGVGKTSIADRGVNNKFQVHSRSTINTEYYSKIVTVDEKVLKLQIWDTCGQEAFNSVVSNFFRNTDFVLLIYSVNDINSLANLPKWLEEIEKFVTNPPIFLIGNKIDLESER